MDYVTLLTDADMGGGLVTGPIDGNEIAGQTVRATYEGSPGGSLTVEGFTGTTWATIAPYTVAVSGAGSAQWGVSGYSYSQYRVRWTRTSGFGRLTVTVSGFAEPGVFADAPVLYFASVLYLADLRARATVNVQPSSLALVARHSDGAEGGGTFRWDATDTRADDDGTIVQPADRSGAGRWLRIIDGNVYHPEWFGARGVGVSAFAPVDSSAAVQACIDALLAVNGGVCQFARGTYYFRNAVVMPKAIGGQSVPLALVGAGPGQHGGSTNGAAGTRSGTCIRAWSDLSGGTYGGTATDPLFLWPVSDPYASLFLRIEDLHLMRGDTGDTTGAANGAGCIRYEYSDPGNYLGGRLKHATFRRCQFYTSSAAGTVVRLEGVQDVTIDSCTFGGGADAFVSYYGSRLRMVNCRTMTKATDRNGITLDTCGESILEKLRFEGSAAGYSLLTLKNAQNVLVASMSAEGSQQDHAIKLDNAHVIRLQNVGFGAVANKIGIEVTNGSSDVEIDVLTGGVTAAAGWRAVHCDATAKHVRGSVHITDGATGVIVADAGAVDVDIRVLEHTASPVYVYSYTAGLVDPFGSLTGNKLTIATGRGDIAGRGLFAGSGTIDTIETGTDGQEIELYFSGASNVGHNKATSAGYSAIRLSGSVDWAPAQHSTLRLRYRASATAWVEVSRCAA